MTQRTKTRKPSQALAEQKDSKAMDHIAIVKKREQEAYEESQAARKLLRASARDTREKRAKYRETYKVWMELYRLWDSLRMKERAEELEEAAAIEIDSETGARVSALLLQILSQVRDGCTVAQFAEYFSAANIDVKKPTISATLYNLKKRGEIEHSDVTGRYWLPARPTPPGGARSGLMAPPPAGAVRNAPR